MSAPSPSDVALGRQLLERGMLNRSQLSFASQKYLASNGTFAGQLVALGLISDQQMSALLAQSRGLDWTEGLPTGLPEQDALALFRREICRSLTFLPLKLRDGRLLVWLGETAPEKVTEWVQRRIGVPVDFLQGTFSGVLSAIDAAFHFKQHHQRDLFDRELRKLQADTQGNLSTEPLLHALVAFAAQQRATDIHIMPDASSILLAFRIDGVLVPMVAIPKWLHRLISAIKVAGGMDIADNLRPQDGRFSHEAAGLVLDIRVSTAVTPHGESVVMRLLTKNLFISGLEDLGFAPEHVPMLRHLFAQPYGIALMAGPTGSGKTTTLYAGLKPLGMSGRSILTVEDPVEYDLPTAMQTQVNRKAGYTFDKAIRHFLRHDPDIMLVGEIRDSETAEAAIKASETGHLVLSTLHVNNVFNVPSRLHSLGVSRLSIAESLLGVVAQRLVRKLCVHCCAPDPVPRTQLPPALSRLLGSATLFKAVGCAHCNDTGYHGRLPAYEILMVDAAISRWIAESGNRHQLRGILTPDNHVPMLNVIAQRLTQGQSSLEEFWRVYGIFDEMTAA